MFKLLSFSLVLATLLNPFCWIPHSFLLTSPLLLHPQRRMKWLKLKLLKSFISQGIVRCCVWTYLKLSAIKKAQLSLMGTLRYFHTISWVDFSCWTRRKSISQHPVSRDFSSCRIHQNCIANELSNTKDNVGWDVKELPIFTTDQLASDWTILQKLKPKINPGEFQFAVLTGYCATNLPVKTQYHHGRKNRNAEGRD